MTGPRFGFGANWRAVSNATPERVRLAEQRPCQIDAVESAEGSTVCSVPLPTEASPLLALR